MHISLPSIRPCITLLLMFIGIHAYSQKQWVNLTGYVKDTEGNPINNATVYVGFNGNNLVSVQSQADGSYHIRYGNWGNIKKINVCAKALSYHGECPIVIDISSYETKHDFVLEKDIVPVWERDVPNICYNRQVYWPSSFYRGGYSSYPGQMFRAPWGTFAYIKHNYYDPIIYHPMITYQVSVHDTHNQPVANARVEIKVADDNTPRWGLTDNNGNLTLHMQFERGAHQGTISIHAEGYVARKWLHRELNIYNQNTFRLHKKVAP